MRPWITFWKAEDEAFDELNVFDHEGLSPLVDSECSVLEAVNAAAILAEVDEHEREAFAAYVENIGARYVDADTPDAFREAYAGAYDSLEAFAEDLLDANGTLERIPEDLRGYFHMEAYARDLRLCGDVWAAEVGGTVHVFWG